MPDMRQTALRRIPKVRKAVQSETQNSNFPTKSLLKLEKDTLGPTVSWFDPYR